MHTSSGLRSASRISVIALSVVVAQSVATRHVFAQQSPTEVVQEILLAMDEERYNDAVALVDSQALMRFREQQVGRSAGRMFMDREVHIDPSLPDCVQEYLRARADSAPPFQLPPQVREYMLLGMPDEDALRALSPRELLAQAMRHNARARDAMPSGDDFPSHTARIVIGDVFDEDRAFVLVEYTTYRGGYNVPDENPVVSVSLTRQDGTWRVTAPAMLMVTGSSGWTQLPLGFE